MILIDISKYGFYGDGALVNTGRLDAASGSFRGQRRWVTRIDLGWNWDSETWRRLL